MDDLTALAPHLPATLLARAFHHENEVAFNRADAIDAVERLLSEGIRVIGVDVWIPAGKNVIISPHFVYDWSEERGANAALTPQAFIRTFGWDPDDRVCNGHEPFFNLTIDK